VRCPPLLAALRLQGGLPRLLNTVLKFYHSTKIVLCFLNFRDSSFGLSEWHLVFDNPRRLTFFSRRPPLDLRFSMLTSRYIFRSLAKNSSLVVRSFRRLDISSKFVPRRKRIHLVKAIPSFKPFILQNYAMDIIFRSLTPPLFSFSFRRCFPFPSTTPSTSLAPYPKRVATPPASRSQKSVRNLENLQPLLSATG